MKNSIIFIINPIAGKGKGKDIEPIIQQFFTDKHLPIQTHFTKKAGHATELTKSILPLNPAMIVACGGDGTVNEVAQVLVGTDIPLGIIPIGSGNGLAANLLTPVSIEKALESILNQKVISIDVGKINGNYFFSNIGFGIDAAVIEKYAQSKKRKLWGYIIASIKVIFSYSPETFTITLENQKELKNDYYFLFCSNSNEAGYGISFTPNAKLNDGKLDLLAIKKLNFIEQIQFSIYTLRKRIDKVKKADILQISSVTFTNIKMKTIVQIDGEAVVLQDKNIYVSVLPNSLNVIIP